MCGESRIGISPKIKKKVQQRISTLAVAADNDLSSSATVSGLSKDMHWNLANCQCPELHIHRPRSTMYLQCVIFVFVLRKSKVIFRTIIHFAQHCVLSPEKFHGTGMFVCVSLVSHSLCKLNILSPSTHTKKRKKKQF